MLSERFANHTDLLQGVIFNPKWYAVFVDHKVRSLTDPLDVENGRDAIFMYFYADDIAITADYPNQLRLMLAIYDEYTASSGTLDHRQSARSSLIPADTWENSHSMVRS